MSNKITTGVKTLVLRAEQKEAFSARARAKRMQLRQYFDYLMRLDDAVPGERESELSFGSTKAPNTTPESLKRICAAAIKAEPGLATEVIELLCA